MTEILARIRGVFSTAAPFDPRHSTRRFVIGAPDGISSVILPPLLETLHGAAPGIDIGIRQLLPVQGLSVPHLAWKDALKELEDRAMDVAIIPFDDIPVRFHKAKLYEEEFVIAFRKGHSFQRNRPSSAIARWSISSFRIPVMFPDLWTLNLPKKT